MNKPNFKQWLAAAAVGCSIVACGGDDAAEPVAGPGSAPAPAPNPAPNPSPTPAPSPVLPAQLPATYAWTSPTSLDGTTQLVRNGTTGTAEGVAYTFAADVTGRITVSGGSVVATMSSIADQGAVLQLCRVAGNSGAAAVMVDAALPAVAAAGLDGLGFDEATCRNASGDFTPSGSFLVVSGGVATYFEDATTPVGQEQVALLTGAGSNQFQSELGTLRWRAFRRPGGSIVIVETQTGGTLAPPAGEPANVRLYVQRP